MMRQVELKFGQRRCLVSLLLTLRNDWMTQKTCFSYLHEPESVEFDKRARFVEFFIVFFLITEFLFKITISETVLATSRVSCLIKGK